uniref:Zn(2)-C6 fungal-type domain-containing protein n=1 Tax=Rhabditophanes sp. KR3021 TaxID=114890 RepID=A0AC35UE10_9BILA
MNAAVQSCKSCKMFTLRSARENRVYKCKRNTMDCEIKAGNGRMCRYCRLAKAIRCGMVVPKRNEEPIIYKKNAVVEVSEACRRNPELCKLEAKQDSFDEEEDFNSDYVTNFDTESDQPMYQNDFESKDIYDTQNIYNTQTDYSVQTTVISNNQFNFSNDVIYPIRSISPSYAIYGGTTLPTKVCIKENKVIFDVDAILNLVKANLHGPGINIPKRNGITYSPLQNLCYALGQHIEQYEQRSREDICISKDMSCKDFSSFSLSAFKLLSVTLMFCPEFCSLSISDRVHMFNNMFALFHTIERCYTSIKTFKNDPRTILLVNGTHATDGMHPYINDKEVPDSVKLNLQKLMNPVTMYQINAIYKPMKELDLCMLEFTYLVGTALYDIQELDTVSEAGKEYSKRVLQSFNDELHSFYTVSSTHRDNYAFRLSEMVKIVAKAQKYISLKGDSMLTAQVFNIFSCSTLFCSKLGLSGERIQFLIN